MEERNGVRADSLDFRALRYLALAAKAGNFGRAARSIGVQTSTISRSVARTEDELGVTLFERGHFGIRLTAAGKAVMVHVRRVLADLEAVRSAGISNGSGNIGQVRAGIRMPPVGTALQNLLQAWHEQFPNVDLIFYEMNERDILSAMEERRLDVAFMTKHTLSAYVVAKPVHRERILLALPNTHPLVSVTEVTWPILRNETFLVQGWDESQTAREFYASFLGSGVRYQTHAASKQTVLALVGAGFGVTLVASSQAEVGVPGVTYKHITEEDAWLEVELVWIPTNEEAVVGRFVAFMRDEAHLRGLIGS